MRNENYHKNVRACNVQNMKWKGQSDYHKNLNFRFAQKILKPQSKLNEQKKMR